MSIVRENLMTRKGYSPYCGNTECRFHMPRTRYIGGQFQCGCGWRSSFDDEFINAYEAKWANPDANPHVTVKALEWKKVALDSNDWNWLEIAKAETPFGTYSLQKHTKGFLRVVFGTQRVGHFEPDQRSEAEASAQADYESRVISCLATAPEASDGEA